MKRFMVVVITCACAELVLIVLLCSTKIGPEVFAGLFFSVMCFGLVSHEIPRIREFSLGWSKVQATMDRAEKLRDEFYAEASAVRELAGHMADIATILASGQISLKQMGDFKGCHMREEARLVARDSIIACLKVAGREKAEIEKVRNELTAYVLGKLSTCCITTLRFQAQAHLDGLIEREKGHVRELEIIKDAAMQPQHIAEKIISENKLADWQKAKKDMSYEMLHELIRQTNCDQKVLEGYFQKMEVWRPDLQQMVEELASFRGQFGLNYGEMLPYGQHRPTDFGTTFCALPTSPH